MLLFGSFNYGKRGILDKTHTRLFTFSSYKNLLTQCGFNLIDISGVPAPITMITGNNIVGNILMKLNKFLIFFSKRIFSYQIYSKVKPQISVELLLEQAKSQVNDNEK